MKFFISILVVFMMLGFVAAPAMACDHDCSNCSGNGNCGHTHNDDCERCGDNDHDHGNGSGSGSSNGGGCQGDSCQI